MPRTAMQTTGMSAFRERAQLALAGLCLLVCAAGCATTVPRTSQQPEPTFKDEVEAAAAETAADAALSAIEWSDLQPQKIYGAAKKLTGYGPNRGVARRLFSEAEDMYRAALAKPAHERPAAFVAAAEKYSEAAERWPKSALEQDALFMAGESYFFADYYHAANEQYELLIKAFPNNRYLDTVDQRRYAIARYWLDIQKKHPESWWAINFWDQERPWRDTHGFALRVYDKIRIDDPTGRLADDATMALASEHFQNRKFQKADEYYTDLRSAYPTSEHQFEAHFNGMKAKLMSYLGPNYGGSALDEAEKLIKQMRRQFPRESAAEREYLDRAAAEIRYKKAQKVFKTAQYFDYRAEYQAAGMYYQKVVKDFDDTSFAEQAQARMAEIAGKPGKPEQYAPWLVDLLPKRDRIQRVLDAVEEYEKQNPRSEQGGEVQQASGVGP